MTVTLPEPPSQSAELHPLAIKLGTDDPNVPTRTPEALEIRVRIVPAALPFDIGFDLIGGIAQLTLNGDLDDSAVMALRQELKRVIAARPREVVLQLAGLRSISDMCARAFAFAQQDLELATTISVIGANPEVKRTLQDVGALDGVTVLDEGDTASPVGAGPTG